MNNKNVPVTVLALLGIVLPACANEGWPGGYPVEERMIGAISLWLLALSLAVEYPFVRWLFGFGVLEALWVDICMNVAATILGYLLATVPILGGGAVYFGHLLFELLHWRTFNPIFWVAACLLAVIITAGIESMVIRLFINSKVGKKGFWGLVSANFISLGVASAAFLLKNPGPH